MDWVNLWPRLLFRAQQIGIKPVDFWQLSVREWRAISADPSRENPMTKSEFETLAKDFKD